VDEKLELESTEFDAYIRNKWGWKNSFISSNTGYVTSYHNYSGSCGIGNPYPSYGLTASYSMGGLYGEGRYGISASWASSSISGACEKSSYAVSASYAITSSWAALDSF
jgi:hypothetical protein